VRKPTPEGYRESLPPYWARLEGVVRWYSRRLPWQDGRVIDAWVLVRLLGLGALLALLPGEPGFAWSVGSVIVVVFLLADILLYQTHVAIEGNQPASNLRLLMLSFLGYATIVMGFAVLYLLQADAFSRRLGVWDSLYFSVVTAGTIGYGDIYPCAGQVVAQATIAAEHLVGLYYLAVVVAVIVNMATNESS